jgi:hypothetical protein
MPTPGFATLERFPLDVNRDSTGDFLWCANQIRLL